MVKSRIAPRLGHILAIGHPLIHDTHKSASDFNAIPEGAGPPAGLAGARKFIYPRAPSDPVCIESVMKPLRPPDYRPLEKEPFMNPMQLEYFRQKLLRWRAELLHESNGTLQHLQEESLSEPDIADRASLETDRGLEPRPRDRERDLCPRA